MITRRFLLTASMLSLAGCAALSKEEIALKEDLVSDFELCRTGIKNFMANAEIEAKAKFSDFKRLIAAKVALEFAHVELQRRDGNVRSIIKDVLFYIEDAAIVADFILTYVPAPFPIPLVVKAIKTLDPVIAGLVGESSKSKVVDTGLTVDEARSILASLPAVK